MTDVDLLQLMVAILPRQAQDDAEGDAATRSDTVVGEGEGDAATRYDTVVGEGEGVAATRSDTVVGFICFYLEESGYDDTKYYPVRRFFRVSFWWSTLFSISTIRSYFLWLSAFEKNEIASESHDYKSRCNCDIYIYTFSG